MIAARAGMHLVVAATVTVVHPWWSWETGTVRTFLNILWVVLGGWLLALEYLLIGLFSCIFIVTIPAGIACFRMSRYAFWPFGRDVVAKPGVGGGSTAMNVVWFIVAGLWLAVGHVIVALAQALTIVGLMNAVVAIKMIPVTYFPFGKEIVKQP